MAKYVTTDNHGGFSRNNRNQIRRTDTTSRLSTTTLATVKVDAQSVPHMTGLKDP